MAFNSQFASNLPWFMFDATNKQYITSPTIPGDITDSKNIVLTETPIPGLNYNPVQPSGNDNRKVAFTLPLIKRNNNLGNSLLLKQFEALRNQGTGLLRVFNNQFSPNPKVLFYWGTGSMPLVYFVSKVSFTHKQGWVNKAGFPQYSEVAVELILDETDPAYKAEEVFRKTAIFSQQIINAIETGTGGKY